MPKLELDSQQRRDLRAAAHPLHPVVLIGDKGLTDAVLEEIDRSLTAHELIKVRVAGAERPDREAMLETICDTLSCATVHHLGKTLIIYRPDVLAQQAAEAAEYATRALRKKSEPYIPKKQAAQPKASRPARKTPAANPAEQSPRRPRVSEETRRAGKRTAAAHGIPRRSRSGSSSGSALSLRAGARRGR